MKKGIGIKLEAIIGETAECPYCGEREPKEYYDYGIDNEYTLGTVVTCSECGEEYVIDEEVFEFES